MSQGAWKHSLSRSSTARRLAPVKMRRRAPTLRMRSGPSKTTRSTQASSSQRTNEPGDIKVPSASSHSERPHVGPRRCRLPASPPGSRPSCTRRRVPATGWLPRSASHAAAVRELVGENHELLGDVEGDGHGGSSHEPSQQGGGTEPGGHGEGSTEQQDRRPP